MRVEDITASLTLMTQDFARGINRVVSMTQTAGRRMQTALQNNLTNNVNRSINGVVESTREMSKGFQNAANIAKGIVISQTFYQITGSIKEAVGALTEYNMLLEESAIAMKYLVGSEEGANAFMLAIKEFAAVTPYTTKAATEASRSLMAMGFAAEDTIPVLSILQDALATSGASSETFGRLVYAFGQIKTAGRLLTRDLMQITNAGIPAFEILQEELGLTKDQMADIGKLSIPADTAIMAILSGLQKRYGGAAEEIAQTTRGLLNQVVDGLLNIGHAVTTGMVGNFKEWLAPLADQIMQLSSIANTQGAGGLLKAIVPPEMLTSIKFAIGMLSELGKSIMDLLAAVRPISREMMFAFVDVFNAAAPVLIMFARTLTVVLQVAGQCAPVIRSVGVALAGLFVANKVVGAIKGVVLAIKALGIAGLVAKVIGTLTGAIKLLTLALVSNPIIAAIAVISVALLGLIASTDAARQTFDKFKSSIAGFFGMDIGKIWEPLDTSDLQAEMDKFFNGLEDGLGNTADGVEDVGDATDKAKKKNDKWVASFDELFRVPDETDKLSDAIEGLGNFKPPKWDELVPDPGLLEDPTEKLDWPDFIMLPGLRWPPLPPPPNIPPIQVPETVNWVPFNIDMPAGYPVEIQQPMIPYTEVWRPFEVEMPGEYPIEVRPPYLPSTEVWNPFKIELPYEFPVEVPPIDLPATKVWRPMRLELPDFKGIQEVISDFGSWLGEEMGQAGDAIGTEIADGVAEGLRWADKFRVDAIGFFAETGTRISETVSGMAEAVSTKLATGFQTGITKADEFRTNVIQGFQNLGSDLSTNVQAAMDSYNGSWAQGFVDNLKNAGGFFVELQGGFSNAWSTLTQGVGQFFSNGFNAATIEGFGQNLNSVDEFTAARLGKITSAGDELATATSGTWSKMNNAAGMGMGVAMEMTQEHMDLVAALEYENGEDRRLTQEEMFDVMLMTQQEKEDEYLRLEEKFGIDRNDIIKSGNEETNKAFWQSFSDMFDDAKEWTGNIGKTISDKWNDVKDWSSDKWGNVKKSVSQNLSTASTDAKDFCGKIGKALSDTWNTAKTNTKTTWDNIGKAITKPIKSAWDTIKPIFDWVGSKFDWLMKKASGIASSVSNLFSKTSKSVDDAEGKSRTSRTLALPNMSSAFGEVASMRIAVPKVTAPMSRSFAPAPSMPVGYNSTIDNSTGGISSSDIKEMTTSIVQAILQNSPSSNGTDLPQANVGILIADDRGLRELERKLKIVRDKEGKRGS